MVPEIIYPETNHPRSLSVRVDKKMYASSDSSFQALGHCYFDVAPGEVVAILGPSGCGKTTLLRLILGLDKEYEGNINVGGHRVIGPGSDRGIVFQEPRLLPWFSVEKNVAFALPDRLTLRKSILAERKQRAQHILNLVGLADFADRLPKALSGGMAQRVALARALVNLPGILLMDEPFGALDSEMRMRLQSELEGLLSKTGTTAVLVTHDVDEALYLSDRIFLMKSRPGYVSKTIVVSSTRPRKRNCEIIAILRKEILEDMANGR